MVAPAGVDVAVLQATFQPILDTLPDAEVPALALRVRTRPGVQTVSGDRLTRQALHVSIELAGTPLLDAIVGEAVVDATGVGCGSLAAAALGLAPPKAGCYDPQADADRRRPEGQPRPPAGRGRPAPVRRPDRDASARSGTSGRSPA